MPVRGLSRNISRPWRQYVSRSCDVLSDPAVEKRFICWSGMIRITRAARVTAMTRPRTLCRPFITAHNATAPQPMSAPREEDATEPTTAVNGKARKNSHFLRVQNGRMPTTKYTAMGTKTHISIPNSPEFENHPGAPYTPQSRKWNPIAAHERTAKRDILRL